MVSASGYVPSPYEIPAAFVEDLAKLGPLLDAGRGLHALGREIFEQHLAIQPSDSDFKKVAYVILGKGFKTSQAIWTLVEEYYQAQKILARKRLPKGKRKQFRGYERKLQPQTQHLLRHFQKRSRGWSQKTLKERAQAVGLGLEYDELYWILCGYKHTLPAGAGGFMLTHPEGVDVIYGPNVEGVFQAAWHAARYFF
jgi:hypothetical protein